MHIGGSGSDSKNTIVVVDTRRDWWLYAMHACELLESVVNALSVRTKLQYTMKFPSHVNKAQQWVASVEIENWLRFSIWYVSVHRSLSARICVARVHADMQPSLPHALNTYNCMHGERGEEEEQPCTASNRIIAACKWKNCKQKHTECQIHFVRIRFSLIFFFSLNLFTSFSHTSWNETENFRSRFGRWQARRRVNATRSKIQINCCLVCCLLCWVCFFPARFFFFFVISNALNAWFISK